GADALQAVYDDALARVEAVRHHAQPLDPGAELHLAIDGLVAGVDDHHELLVLVGADRTIADQERGFGLRLAHAEACKLPRYQPAVRVVEDSPQAHRTAAGVKLIVDQLEMALKRRSVAGHGLHLDRD